MKAEEGRAFCRASRARRHLHHHRNRCPQLRDLSQAETLSLSSFVPNSVRRRREPNQAELGREREEENYWNVICTPTCSDGGTLPVNETPQFWYCTCFLKSSRTAISLPSMKLIIF